MGTFDLTLGCLMFSSWANMVLLTLELSQIYKYFLKYPKDTLFNRASVIVALLSDTTTVVACLAGNYLYMVTHWGQSDYLLSQPWCIPVYIGSTAITCAVVQIWLCRMVYHLTHQWFWIPFIAIFILTGMAGAAATAALIGIDPSYAAREALVKWVTIWLAACAAADTVITVILVWRFRSIKATFSDTQNMIRRLSVAAMRNGSITTVLTIITLAVFTSQPETNSAVMIEITIGRIYTLSMLSNLNNRGAGEGESQSSTSRKATTVDPNRTIVRIHQDIETHYQRDEIPMGHLEYDQKTRQISDQSSEADLPVSSTGLVANGKRLEAGF